MMNIICGKNPVAKFAHKYNRSSVQPDKKKDYKRNVKHKGRQDG